MKSKTFLLPCSGDEQSHSRRVRGPAALSMLALSAALLVPVTGVAATATTTFNVTATVLSSCQVSASNMAFGVYDPASATDANTTSTITITCSLLTPYNVGLNSGTYASGSTRRMGSGTNRLSYEIYKDATHLNVLGTVAAALGFSGIGTGLAVPTTIYGVIPNSQNVPAGSYADVITVSVDY